MGSEKKQPKFSHGKDWQLEHERMAEDRDLIERLKFDGVIVDAEGKPRLLVRCPACGSTFSSPQMSWARVLAFLGEQLQKCFSSVDVLTSYMERAESAVVLHLPPPPPAELASSSSAQAGQSALAAPRAALGR